MYYFHFKLPREVTQGQKKPRLIWQFPVRQAKSITSEGFAKDSLILDSERQKL